MATTPNPFHDRKEHPSTYVVQDRSNQEELLRLDQQDRMYTTCMGGMLPEQPDPASFQRVLDVGCGPGWWLIETAKIYPSISLLTGVDISGKMIDAACRQAEAAGVSDRVHFQTGDALRLLEFPNHSFDLVNQRFGASWLRKWDWPRLLREYQRVCRPDGIIRITEAGLVSTNSPALTQLFAFLVPAFYQAGHFFSPDSGVIDHLAGVMEQYGIDQVQTKVHVIAYHTNPQTKQAFAEDVKKGFRTFGPFLRKWTRLPSNYDDLYQQMVQEIQQPDFEATQSLLTVWGASHGSLKSDICLHSKEREALAPRGAFLNP